MRDAAEIAAVMDDKRARQGVWRCKLLLHRAEHGGCEDDGVGLVFQRAGNFQRAATLRHDDDFVRALAQKDEGVRQFNSIVEQQRGYGRLRVIGSRAHNPIALAFDGARLRNSNIAAAARQ